MKAVLNNIIISIEMDQEKAITVEIEKKGIDLKNVERIKWLKRSIDSRRKTQVKFLYNLELTFKKKFDITDHKYLIKPKKLVIKPRVSKKLKGKIAVVGSGPAGLFAALRLCEYGYTPIIFERGKKIEDRDRSIDEFYEDDNLDINSNIQFGEGGAGTYSDGKLNTRIKSEYITHVFETFVELGAQKEIMWDYKPHIGTDILKVVTQNLRNKIISMGGVFYFETLVEEVRVKDKKISGIQIKNISKEREPSTKFMELDHLVLAIGHSARDTYRMLHKNGVFMENKPFAMGTRIEHKRSVIDNMQYGKLASHQNLGAATYSMTYNNKEEARGVFSFCMCPGGVIVNAASQKNTSLVNGMSYSDRSGEFSNSAIAVGIKANEFGDHLFSGMEFQETLEKKAYEIIGNYGGIAQRVTDFIGNKTSIDLPATSYPMRLKSYNMNDFFPEVITRNFNLAFKKWKGMVGFISSEALLIGPETRTSAPVKITRNEMGESINIKGLYPIGEGAGYAGGITSAAIDGLKIIDNIFSEIIKNDN